METSETRVVNLRHETYTLYIGRGSKWGNSFRIGKDGTRKEVIEKYKKYLEGSYLMDDIHELKGQILGCYCKPEACHGDILVELVDGCL